MKTPFFTLCVLSVSALLLADHHEGPAQGPVASDEHGVLQHDVGNWKAAIKVWMPGVEQPITATATESNKFLPGGLWLISKMEGDFGGQEFHGQGMFGYDPTAKKYVGTWVDNMSPYVMTMKGTYDQTTSTMTMYGETLDPISGQPYKSKTETKYSDGKRVMMMWKMEGDDPVKHMEITYTLQTS